MDSIQSIYEVKTSPSLRSKDKTEKTETIAVKSVGQKAANAVDKKYKNSLFRKILKGFMINEVFILLHK